MSANSIPWKPTVCALCITMGLMGNDGLCGAQHSFEIFTDCAMFDTAPGLAIQGGRQYLA
jgi:hypothetical protein